MRGLSPYVAILALALSLGTAAARAASPPAGSAAARERQLKAVVHTWSDRLNAGDAGVARLFALPTIVIQGQYGFRFHTRAQLAQWHSGLPCSGRIVSIAIRGRYATAVFRLGNRGKSRCDAPGTLAAAVFEIVDGKIVQWQQVPVPQEEPPSGNVA